MRQCLSVYLLFLTIMSSTVQAESHHPEDFLNKIKGRSDEGQQIYNHFCVTCHAQNPLIALGAPRYDNEIEWTMRLKQEINVLLKNTEEGLNAMPPRGGGFECTDKQLILAILYMLPKNTKKDLLNKLKDHKKHTK